MSSSRSSKVRTRCPVCRAKYNVPAAFVSHHAKCTKCQTRFVVQEYSGHPTEEDILRWLNEGNEDGQPAHSPRVVTHVPHHAPTPTTSPLSHLTDEPDGLALSTTVSAPAEA